LFVFSANPMVGVCELAFAPTIVAIQSPSHPTGCGPEAAPPEPNPQAPAGPRNRSRPVIGLW
jgi:hypothetical protein